AEKAKQLSPEVISLDIFTPKGNGLDALFEFRHAPITANIPVIVISVVDERNIGFALGASDYLLKPIERNALLEAVQKHLPAKDHQGEKILVVDDDRQTLELIGHVLR